MEPFALGTENQLVAPAPGRLLPLTSCSSPSASDLINLRCALGPRRKGPAASARSNEDVTDKSTSGWDAL